MSFIDTSYIEQDQEARREDNEKTKSHRNREGKMLWQLSVKIKGVRNCQRPGDEKNGNEKERETSN